MAGLNLVYKPKNSLTILFYDVLSVTCFSCVFFGFLILKIRELLGNIRLACCYSRELLDDRGLTGYSLYLFQLPL